MGRNFCFRSSCRPAPAPLFADEYERERTVCIDSRNRRLVGIFTVRKQYPVDI